ncbi:MAG: lytic transglycosylase domain-containing protein [Pseudomonadota bacterium]
MKWKMGTGLARFAKGAVLCAVCLLPPWALAEVPATIPPSKCDPSGAHCIDPHDNISDICTVIGDAAVEHGLPQDFFARLIWQESLFDAFAISHAGAEGIAQFMPMTALRRGLANPYNPAASLVASAAYLADLRDQFGNLGLAAAAYNSGEDRTQAFVTQSRPLPRETRGYVATITGLDAITWRDGPPADAIERMRLPGEGSFHSRCVDLASTRSLAPLGRPSGGGQGGWLAVVGTHDNRAALANRLDQAVALNPILRLHKPQIARRRVSGLSTMAYVAYVRVPTRERAEILCQDVKRARTSCAVAPDR